MCKVGPSEDLLQGRHAVWFVFSCYSSYCCGFRAQSVGLLIIVSLVTDVILKEVG